MNTAASTLVLFISACICGLVIRQSLVFSEQKWAASYSMTTSYLLLPLIGLAIVQVISNNIALSLGMVGALSIVRFRHPVKSPLELVIYFLLLTIGISLSVSPARAFLLTIASAILIVGLSKVYLFAARKGMLNISPSTMYGPAAFVIEIESSAPIPDLLRHKRLAYCQEDREATNFSYKLIGSNLAEATDIEAIISTSASINQVTRTFE